MGQFCEQDSVINIFNPQKPALIVSLTGASLMELRAQYLQVPPAVDIVEWRVDKVLKRCDISELPNIATSLAKFIRQPILATVRTSEEGGENNLNSEKYFQIINKISESTGVALIDLEMNQKNSLTELKTQAEMLRKKKIGNIFSKHYFCAQDTRKILKQGIQVILNQAFACGADIAKLAIWVETPKELLALLQQTNTYHERYPDRRILVIGMGPVGQSSRLIGGVFGSCATFAAIPAGEGKMLLSSAPGQLPADLLDTVLKQLQIK